MRFLIDEDVDVRIIRLLRSLGHDAKRVPSGTLNGAVIRFAAEENRILISRNADFTNTETFPPSKYPGIIHLDIHPPRFNRIASPLKAFLKDASEAALSGKLVLLTEEGAVVLP